jgi:hypothetical protein
MQFSIIKLDLVIRNLDLDFYLMDIPFLIFCFCWAGKRYVHGMGSETRNSLYHMHNTASYDTASHNTALLIFCVCWAG